MRYQYRLTKYDPRLRSNSGAFPRKDWTSISDIGKNFGGRRLTKAAYLRVEESYLCLIHDLLTEAGVTRLSVRDVEAARMQRPLPAWLRKTSLSIPEALCLSRTILRERLWAKLVAPRRAFVHFGYDFYVYVGLSRSTPVALNQAHRYGLYLEPFRSPHGRGAG